MSGGKVVEQRRNEPDLWVRYKLVGIPARLLDDLKQTVTPSCTLAFSWGKWQSYSLSYRVAAITKCNYEFYLSSTKDHDEVRKGNWEGNRKGYPTFMWSTGPLDFVLSHYALHLLQGYWPLSVSLTESATSLPHLDLPNCQISVSRQNTSG